MSPPFDAKPTDTSVVPSNRKDLQHREAASIPKRRVRNTIERVSDCELGVNNVNFPLILAG